MVIESRQQRPVAAVSWRRSSRSVVGQHAVCFHDKFIQFYSVNYYPLVRYLRVSWCCSSIEQVLVRQALFFKFMAWITVWEPITIGWSFECGVHLPNHFSLRLATNKGLRNWNIFVWFLDVLGSFELFGRKFGLRGRASKQQPERTDARAAESQKQPMASSLGLLFLLFLALGSRHPTHLSVEGSHFSLSPCLVHFTEEFFVKLLISCA